MNLRRIMSAVVQRGFSYFYSTVPHNISILMFHEVVPIEMALGDLSIDPNRFEELIDTTAHKIKAIENIDKTSEEAVVITFDDIYESVFLNAVPVLTDRNIPFTVFISPSYIGKRGFVTEDELIELINNPLCTIGFHTNSHKYMSELNREEVVWEIDASEFENKYKIKCDIFAYPYGSCYTCPPRIVKQLEKSRFKYSFGTINSSFSFRYLRSKAYIPRINVSEKTFDSVMRKFRSMYEDS